jgi:hypothetical protein
MIGRFNSISSCLNKAAQNCRWSLLPDAAGVLQQTQGKPRSPDQHQLVCAAALTLDPTCETKRTDRSKLWQVHHDNFSKPEGPLVSRHADSQSK